MKSIFTKKEETKKSTPEEKAKAIQDFRRTTAITDILSGIPLRLVDVQNTMPRIEEEPYDYKDEPPSPVRPTVSITHNHGSFFTVLPERSSALVGGVCGLGAGIALSIILGTGWLSLLVVPSCIVIVAMLFALISLAIEGCCGEHAVPSSGVSMST